MSKVALNINVQSLSINDGGRRGTLYYTSWWCVGVLRIHLSPRVYRRVYADGITLKHAKKQVKTSAWTIEPSAGSNLSSLWRTHTLLYSMWCVYRCSHYSYLNGDRYNRYRYGGSSRSCMRVCHCWELLICLESDGAYPNIFSFISLYCFISYIALCACINYEP